MGISLGKTNYCLKAIIERGWVKMGNFTRSDNKIAYLYKLTPSGIAEKARAARVYLAHKLDEHERIRAEIETLRDEVLNTQSGAKSGDVP